MTIDNRQVEQQGEEVSRLGSALYDSLIQPEVASSPPSHFVAIHVDTRDYAVAPSSSAATRILRTRHPADGRIFVRRISDDPDYGMSMRILAGENAPYSAR